MKRIVLVFLLISGHLLFSYNYFSGWWYASIGTAFIFLVSFLIWGKDVSKMTGTNMSIKELLYSFSLVIFLILCSYLVMSYIGKQKDIAIQRTLVQNYIHIFFYTLNEEIILGSLLLFSLKKIFPKKTLALSIGVAAAFSIIHFVFYKWIFLEQGSLSITTLTVLMLVGIVRNNLILKYGHIGYALALHFGWMAIMFGSHHYYVSSGTRLIEPERFNLYLGSLEMLCISMFLAGLSIIYFKRPIYSK